MTSAGFPDFLQKGASPIDFLGSFDVNTGGTQAFDITSVISQAHSGLLVVWTASLAYLGGSIDINVGANLNALLMVPDSVIADGDTLIVPFAGIYITANAGNTCTMQAILPSGFAGPATGKILLFGINDTPLFVPAIRRHLIGRGNTTGNIGVAAATTATVLGAPRQGQYYRIKMLSFRITAAPAAVANITWVETGTLALIHQFICTVAASQHQTLSVDFEWDGGIALNNGSNAVLGATVVYEIWSV